MTKTVPWKTWPQWLVDAIVAAYKSGMTPAQIGEYIWRTEGEVRYRLVKEGVYISQSEKRQLEIRETVSGF
jgi:hypothetical protein